MKDQKKMTTTTIRLGEKMIAQIEHLAEQSGATQSDVIRHLIELGLRDKSKIVFSTPTVASEEEKTMLLDIADKLSAIRSELNRIGSNINIRRKNYNGKRKAIEDKVRFLDTSIQNAKTDYEKIKYTAKQAVLKDSLEEYDSKDTKLVSNSEWEQFRVILMAYEKINNEIGEKLS